MITADHPFLGRTTISRDGFAWAIRSRAYNEGIEQERDLGEYYDAALSYGLDANLLLGMWVHESRLSTAGVSVQTRSAGNTRGPSMGACPIDIVPGRTGFFPVFASFLDGVLSTAARLASPVWPTGAPYGERTSIREIFSHPSNAVWAPSSDLNDPNSYLSSLLKLMNQYSDLDPPQPITATAAHWPLIYQDYLETNFTPGRSGHSVRAQVLHVTQGASAASAVNWFKNPTSDVSSHYVIDRDGTVYAVVREDSTAWTQGILNKANLDKALVRRWVAGNISPNLECVGIECAGYSSTQPAGQPPELVGYSEAQFTALGFLLPAIAQRWAIAIDDQATLSHGDIDGVNRANCPGLSAEEWQRVYAMDESAPVPVTDDELLDIRWQEAQAIVGEKVAAALLTRPWVEGGTTKVLRCERGWVGQTDEIEERLTDDCDTLLTGAGMLQRL